MILPAILDVQLLARAQLSREHLTITRGQLAAVVAACKRINRDTVPYTLVANEGNVTYILWRSYQS